MMARLTPSSFRMFVPRGVAGLAAVGLIELLAAGDSFSGMQPHRERTPGYASHNRALIPWVDHVCQFCGSHVHLGAAQHEGAVRVQQVHQESIQGAVSAGSVSVHTCLHSVLCINCFGSSPLLCQQTFNDLCRDGDDGSFSLEDLRMVMMDYGRSFHLQSFTAWSQ